MKIRKDDKVVVLSGRDKGKEGKVLSADPKNGKVIVEGGIIQRETPIYASKVMLVCPKCGKPTRVGHTVIDGEKVRACKKCGAAI